VVIVPTFKTKKILGLKKSKKDLPMGDRWIFVVHEMDHWFLLEATAAGVASFLFLFLFFKFFIFKKKKKKKKKIRK